MCVLKTILIICLINVTVKCSPLRAAPYYMPLDNNGQSLDISHVIQTTGVKQFILAFVLGPNGGGCVPTWDGDIKQKVSDDTSVLNKIKQIRSAGGDVSVSFGGYNGQSLGHACPDINSLVNAYQSVIDKYSLTNIDFDVENANLGDVNGENNRFKAIKILKEKAKANGKELFVTLTLPSTTVGLSDLGRSEINRGIADGAHIDLYKVMAFDYGGGGADQVNSVKGVMDLVHTQIKKLRTDLSDSQAYSATGLILMNGHTDQPSELYTVETFKQLISYANEKKFGRVSFWALNRDMSCGNKHVGWVNGECSSVDQQPWDFTKTLSNFHYS